VPLPAGLDLVTVGGSVLGSDGTPATGTAEFALPAPLLDGNDQVILGTAPIVGSITNGVLSMQVPANDTPGVSPVGWAYVVTIRTDVLYLTFKAVVPSTPTHITLDQLVQVADPPVPQVYVPLQALGVSVATLGTDGKVPANQLPSGSGGNAVASVTAADGTITIGGTATNPTVKVASNAGLLKTQLASAVQTSLGAADTAYQKPGGGIPKTDLAAAVQTSLGKADTALQIAPAPEDAVRYGCHTRNVPVFAITRKSTINNEAWFARVLVRAGVPVASVSVFRTALAATVGAGGLNGMAIFADAGGAPIASTVSDDTMWQATGQITKPISGPTPSVDTWYWVGVSARGYSVAPEFGFVDDADTGILADIGGLARYKAGGYTPSWPSNLVPGTDLTTGSGFVLPIYLG